MNTNKMKINVYIYLSPYQYLLFSTLALSYEEEV